MQSPAYYKFLALVLAVLLALGGAYAAKIIHDAQLEVNRFRQQEEDLQKQTDAKLVELQKYQEFFMRLKDDPAFLEYVARQRLADYAKPEEIIFRWDVDPLTGATPVGNLDGSKALQLSPPGTTARPNSASGSSSPSQKPR